ncbi:hypothetical protein LINPERPRIM_LOCUS25063 [Linum perenne]
MDASIEWMHHQHELASTFNGSVGKNVHNISMQTGEEFSMEFLQERVNARGTRPIPKTGQHYDKICSFHNDLTHQLGYEDIARVISLKRMDSDLSTSSMGSPKENENSYFLDKVTWVNMEDCGNAVHKSRMEFGELNDRGPGLGSTTSFIYAHESPSADNITGRLNFSDRLHPGKIKLLCSVGGNFLPRPGDGKLRYVGGETRIISITKNLSWMDLVRKTSCICIQPHFIKYQLPGEDLDALISVSSDEDLQNMLEEYYGVENLGGSPRLRIFLIPMGEYDNFSSFVATTSIQQSSPDFQYVVAVNGNVDPSSRTNYVGRSSGSDSSALPVKFNHNPIFPKRAPPSLLPLEINDGLNSFQNMRSQYPSPPISPVPCSSVPFPRDRSSMESNSSFMTTSLSSDGSSLNTSFHKQLQRQVSLTKYRHPCKHIDGGQSEQPFVSQYQNFHLNKEVGSSSSNSNDFYQERNIQRGHHFLSENPISISEDSRGILMSDSFDAPHGMPHAFSDSKLQERGEMSAYYSQEGMGTSPQLKFSKTQISNFFNSSISRENSFQRFESCHRDIHLVDDKYHGSTLNNENLMGTETTNKNDQTDPLLNHCKMSFWEKPPIDCKRKLLNCNIDPLPSCGNSLSRNIQTHAEEYSTDGESKPPINNLEHSQNYHLDSGPSNLLMSCMATSDQLCAPSITVSHKQEVDMSKTEIAEVKLKSSSQHPNGESSLHDLVFKPSNNTFSVIDNAIQTTDIQRGMCISERLHMRPEHAFTLVDENIDAKVNLKKKTLYCTM